MNRPVASMLAVLMTGLLAACSSQPVKKDEAAVPPMSSADTASLLSSLANPQPLPELPLTTRSFLLASEQPDTSALAHSFVLLPWRSIGAEGAARHQATCSGLRSALERAEGENSSASSLLMPLYWPLARDADLENCDQLVERHDYLRARELLGRPLSDLQGPLLAAWPRDGGKVLVLDMTRYSPQDIEQALHFWVIELAHQPQYWNADGVNLNEVRKAMAGLLARNGQKTLALHSR